ncbi:hypothetical protein B0T16DRAFT_70968 [Cercophora newfieldiana]|uniref:Uncharacterized protein n=1 Tax=Cercophora newfieldiana TaxID=92897 RepID=A0AA39YUZ8_9PEZI|nr:hypothetical protein B0T16DRAFT_70968 [Cercophora newfieldiana]
MALRIQQAGRSQPYAGGLTTAVPKPVAARRVCLFLNPPPPLLLLLRGSLDVDADLKMTGKSGMEYSLQHLQICGSRTIPMLQDARWSTASPTNLDNVCVEQSSEATRCRSSSPGPPTALPTDRQQAGSSNSRRLTASYYYATTTTRIPLSLQQNTLARSAAVVSHIKCIHVLQIPPNILASCHHLPAIPLSAQNGLSRL